MKTLNFYRKSYLAYILGFMILFVSCKQYNDFNNDSKYKGKIMINFEYYTKNYNSFKTKINSDLSFINFKDFKVKFNNELINYTSYKNDEITEEEWQQIEGYLIQLGFFNTNANVNLINQNYFNFLYSNNYISHRTYQFIVNSIPDFTSLNKNLDFQIISYMNNYQLNNMEISILNYFLFLVEQNKNKSIGCSVACGSYSYLWGWMAAGLFTPVAGFAVGLFAGVLCDDLCSNYY